MGSRAGVWLRHPGRHPRHREIPGGARLTPTGMLGYSGGSIATEWASELAPSYAPELNIIGAA